MFEVIQMDHAVSSHHLTLKTQYLLKEKVCWQAWPLFEVFICCWGEKIKIEMRHQLLLTSCSVYYTYQQS